MQFINIGYGNIIAADRIISIITPGAAPTKRMVQEARKDMLVIDATTRKKNKSSNHYGYWAYHTFCCPARNSNQ